MPAWSHCQDFDGFFPQAINIYNSIVYNNYCNKCFKTLTKKMTLL
jgi:hypothetical protein